jgi:hypothetical protein
VPLESGTHPHWPLWWLGHFWRLTTRW